MLTILRNANMLPNVRWRRIHRVGRWIPNGPPRPILVEFRSQFDRDRLLAKLPQIYNGVSLPLRITPDIKVNEEWGPTNRPLVTVPPLSPKVVQAQKIDLGTNNTVDSTDASPVTAPILVTTNANETQTTLPFIESDAGPPASTPDHQTKRVDLDVLAPVKCQVQGLMRERRLTRSAVRKNELVPRELPPRDISV